MAMLIQANIALACTNKLVVRSAELDMEIASDPAKAEERLRGKYPCNPANSPHGSIVEAMLSKLPKTSKYNDLTRNPSLGLRLKCSNAPLRCFLLRVLVIRWRNIAVGVAKTVAAKRRLTIVCSDSGGEVTAFSESTMMSP
jgi:hypothetical protein